MRPIFGSRYLRSPHPLGPSFVPTQLRVVHYHTGIIQYRYPADRKTYIMTESQWNTRVAGEDTGWGTLSEVAS